MKRTILIEGKSLEDALEEAARKLGHPPAADEYKQVENRAGFWGMNRKVVLELVVPDDYVDADAAPAPEPVEEAAAEPPATPRAERPRREPVTAAPGADPMEKARIAVEEMIQGTGLDLKVTVSRSEDRIRVELSGPDTGKLEAERGELLLAIQYLASKLVARQAAEPVRIDVDAAGFREKRHAELVALARKTAEAVRQTGKKALLPPMAPAERREIHMALSDHPEVTTESEGDGFRKRVAIFPRKRGA